MCPIAGIRAGAWSTATTWLHCAVPGRNCLAGLREEKWLWRELSVGTFISTAPTAHLPITQNRCSAQPGLTPRGHKINAENTFPPCSCRSCVRAGRSSRDSSKIIFFFPHWFAHKRVREAAHSSYKPQHVFLPARRTFPALNLNHTASTRS